MTIDEEIIIEFEQKYRRTFSSALKRYLLVKYGDEPFPYEYSEQDLYEHIRHDIRDYDNGKLNLTVKSPTERWSEERDYLHTLYIQKDYEAYDLEKYIAELEQILMDHGLKSAKMAERLIEAAQPNF